MQVRLWCMTIPVDGIAPIILAVLPISDSESSASLLLRLQKILLGLIDKKIQVISYSCDGTEVERKLQRLILGKADTHLQYKIKSPRPGIPATTIKIPVINGQPLCLLQDSKHALKTLRNNLFSGARLLTLGNHVILYATIRDIAFSNGSPLYRRDVEKLDRQDDNAASRLFSADTLSYLTSHYPDHAGEIVYLFVFGDLVDAYQNRSLSHCERIKMPLRAKYFLDYWKQFIAHAGYKKNLHFLSREATDILRLIIEGLLALVYLYRDHLTNPDDINPSSLGSIRRSSASTSLAKPDKLSQTFASWTSSTCFLSYVSLSARQYYVHDRILGRRQVDITTHISTQEDLTFPSLPRSLMTTRSTPQQRRLPMKLRAC